MKVCFATSECVPYAKTGGLADVSASLSRALARLGCKVKMFHPLYRSLNPKDHHLTFAEELKDLTVFIAGKPVRFNVWYKKEPGLALETYFIDCPMYFDREAIYTDDTDEDERFIFFQDAIIRVLQQLAWAPDILHCNDWQTALLPVYLKLKYSWDRLFAGTRSLLTLHNLEYQGKFSPETIGKAGLPMDYYYPTGPFEFYGQFSFLKAGIVFADVLNTVSETYAREIQTPEFGAGLDGVLRTRKADLYGILNGIDTVAWNPRSDTLIPYRYGIKTLKFKAQNTASLRARAGLPAEERIPLIGIVARLVHQKGFDLLPPIWSQLMELPAQWVVLGTGEREFEDFFRRAAKGHPQKVAAFIEFNNELAHWITAGSDLFLMPSKYEPCGLNQMYSLNYGTVPVVRKTGGLADTVIDIDENPTQGNGFVFGDYSPAALLFTLRRALDRYPDPSLWRKMMLRGMRADFSWKRSAQKYLELYQKALGTAGRQ